MGANGNIVVEYALLSFWFFGFPVVCKQNVDRDRFLFFFFIWFFINKLDYRRVDYFQDKYQNRFIFTNIHICFYRYLEMLACQIESDGLICVIVTNVFCHLRYRFLHVFVFISQRKNTFCTNIQNYFYKY